jgi:hypothetical protein
VDLDVIEKFASVVMRGCHFSRELGMCLFCGCCVRRSKELGVGIWQNLAIGDGDRDGARERDGEGEGEGEGEGANRRPMRREQNRSQKYISSIEGKFERGETVCLCS